MFYDVVFAPRTHRQEGPRRRLRCATRRARWVGRRNLDGYHVHRRTGGPAVPKNGADRRHAAMDASASASPVALLSCVIGGGPSPAERRRRPGRSQIYKMSGFTARHKFRRRVAVHADPENFAMSVRSGHAYVDRAPMSPRSGTAGAGKKKFNNQPAFARLGILIVF